MLIDRHKAELGKKWDSLGKGYFLINALESHPAMKIVFSHCSFLHFYEPACLPLVWCECDMNKPLDKK